LYHHRQYTIIKIVYNCYFHSVKEHLFIDVMDWGNACRQGWFRGVGRDYDLFWQI
jgi:hypothetical protein